MSTSITPFLMFTGNAGAALELYTSVFPDSEIEEIEPDDLGEGETDGMALPTIFRLQNQRFMCIDSPVETPSRSPRPSPSSSIFNPWTNSSESTLDYRRTGRF